MYGQMTAGSWIYIGSQGIVQGTYETFAAVAEKLAARSSVGGGGGGLAGTLTVTAGLGGMGGAQPLAVTLNGGAVLCIECDPARAHRRVATRYLDVVADTLDEGIDLAVAARADGRALSVGVIGNAAEVLPDLLRRGVPVDIVTDQTSAHDPLAYLPTGVALEDWHDYAAAKPEEFTEQGPGIDGPARRGDGRLPRRRRGGVRLRQLDPRRGPRRRLRARLRLPGLRPGVHPAAVLPRQGPVPVGRAVRRPEGHPRDRPRRPRPVPGRREAAALDAARARPGGLSGPAGPHLLARRRRAGSRRARLQRARRLRQRYPRRSSSAATISTPGPWRRRTGRPNRWPTAATRSPTGRC